MVRWPDDESMLKEYVDELGYSEAASHCGWLRQFQRFVRQHSPHFVTPASGSMAD